MPSNTTAAKPKAAPAKPAARSRRTVKTAAAATKPEKKKVKKVAGKEVVKVKVVRDSFTMPQNDYAKIGELKLVCQKAGLQVKKSELLRAGLYALTRLSTAQLKQTIAQIEQIKTGRPKKS